LHIAISDDPRAGAIERIRSALADARAARRAFIASAARHSMGGHAVEQRLRRGQYVLGERARRFTRILADIARQGCGIREIARNVFD
jgi:hypothetical protein